MDLIIIRASFKEDFITATGEALCGFYVERGLL
jgi:hypothetical protein